MVEIALIRKLLRSNFMSFLYNQKNCIYCYMIILDYQNPEKQLKVFAKVLAQAKVKLRWSCSLACQIFEVRVASGHKLTKKAHGCFKSLGNESIFSIANTTQRNTVTAPLIAVANNQKTFYGPLGAASTLQIFIVQLWPNCHAFYSKL